MRMTVTKVKPVVVKHILNNQVMSIYDIKVTKFFLIRNLDSYGEPAHAINPAGSRASTPNFKWDFT